ncbi:MAG: RimK family protein [Gammaproteobacteria bacterium]|nr:RimK family protein [Gammaproteobacteria bacterium]
MADLLIVVEKDKDWRAYYPSDQVIPVQTYLATSEEAGNAPGDQVINLCRSTRYLSNGYYCSLLAEARGQRVIPSVRTINDLSRKSIYGLGIGDLNRSLGQLLGSEDDETGELTLKFFFGQAADPALERFARQLFEQFPCPILEVTFRRSGADWIIHELNSGSIHELDGAEEDRFATALDGFSRKVWRKPKARKRYRYDMAILVDPEEKFPPSDDIALRKFVRAGRDIGFDVELITRRDFVRVGEFDALFIRATTAIDDHTYRFSKKAESEGLIVIDDPDSILKCTNKVYLADLLRTNRLPTPGTRIVSRDRKQDLDEAAAEFGFPLVLKIPDGSFSRGVTKAENLDDLRADAKRLFRESALLLVQEYVYTEYDWRIGILNRKPIYASQYFMSRGHWQIYDHSPTGKGKSGGWKTVPVHDAPAPVVRAATRAANLIGDGLYGVDIKMSGGRVCIIEVNDNPSIESRVEDAYLGDDLYRIIMEEFLRRLERKRLGV